MTQERKTVADAVKHFKGGWPYTNHPIIIFHPEDGFAPWFEPWPYSPECETYQVCTKQEFEETTREILNSWHERGELPPVGTEVEYYSATNGWCGPAKVFHITKKGLCFVEYEEGGWDMSQEPSQFRPIQPKPQKIDMSVFAGTDIWVIYGGTAYEAKDLNLECITDESIAPKMGNWNSVNDLTEEPEWCKPFNYDVVCRYGDVGFIDSSECEKPLKFDWEDVCAIRFDSIKDGWEL